MFYYKITKLLKQRGKTADFLVDVRLQDDGSGPYIAAWDEEKLGPKPTQEELDAIDVTADLHNAEVLRKIAELEAKVTPRRIREAVRGAGKAWLDNLDDQIAAERTKLL